MSKIVALLVVLFFLWLLVKATKLAVKAIAFLGLLIFIIVLVYFVILR